MVKRNEIAKEFLVYYSEGSEMVVVPAESCHGTNIHTEVCVPFNNESLGYYVLVNVDGSNHILMMQKDIRTFTVVAFNVEVHRVGTVRELERGRGGILKRSRSFFLSIFL